tara:strand:+ start:92 stop:286 length:195 start_codon:yes stop_codon:yes gene_type:complete
MNAFNFSRTKLPELVLYRLTREANMHLISRSSTPSLRALCRQFLADNPIPPKAWERQSDDDRLG